MTSIIRCTAFLLSEIYDYIPIPVFLLLFDDISLS